MQAKNASMSKMQAKNAKMQKMQNVKNEKK